jgi:predicted permease
MDRFRQDIRFAIRSLRRARGFSAVALVTLALGIGANTAIFSIVNGVLLRPLGYPDPGQLMFLTTQFPSLGFPQFWVSPPEYLEFREMTRSFSALGAYATGEVNLTADDRPLRVRTALVDEHLLNALGVRPASGRLFGPGETDLAGPLPGPGTRARVPPAIAVLSYELWQRAFGGRDVVGETVEIDGYRREIIGVMARGVDVMDNRTEVWLPLGLDPANRQNRGNHFLYVIGRLKDGVTPQMANAELGTLIATWGERIGIKSGPGPGAHLFVPLNRPGGHVLQMEPLRDEMLGGASRAIWVLQAAVALVLLIACANLANLLLARAERRQRELAVLTALGAGRFRLLRQFMVEGVLLSLAGGALGLLLAHLAVRALVRAYPASLPRTGEIGIDPAVLLFTLGVSMASGLLFALAPIAHTRVKGLMAALKESGAKGATAAARHRIRGALVTAEVALAVMVVIGAGLLVRTVSNLTAVEAGFNRSRLVTFSMTLPQATSEPDSRARMYQTVLAALRGVAGVETVTAMTGLPPNRPINANSTDIDNYTAPPEGPFEIVDYYQNVMTDYFSTMGIPIVQGRGFEPRDAASAGMVAVVNERLANIFWKGQNPIGQRLRPCCGDQVPWYTVIGVARDVKQGGLEQAAGTEFYFFVDQIANLPPDRRRAPFTMNVVLRTTLPPATLAPAIERTVRGIDPAVPVVRLREMDDVFAESIQRPRLLAQLLGTFAGLALLLAAIGTYAMLSFLVAERRREIGIRLTLGAERGRVLAHVMRQGLTLTVLGVVIGLAGAIGVTRLLTSLLFGVQATDPTTMVAVVLTILLVASAACGLPAWRASRVDPNIVLRDE